MPSETSKLALLCEPLPVEDVKQRRQGGVMLDYISIDATIRRFNDVLGSAWSTEVVGPIHLDTLADGNFLAVVTISLSALDKRAVGVGADRAGDPDKAIKTALAEAIKKAGHQFGVGLYLWQESEREIVAQQRRKAVNTDTGENRAPERETLGSGGF